MATPSSSATSPSPPVAYFIHNPVHSSQPMISSSTDSLEREQRQKAIKKFLARAEISMVTRALRTRLSYASYKATHNIHHASLRDIEAHSQSQAASFSRTIAAKRKASGSSHQVAQGSIGSATGTGFLRRGGPSTMPPPASTSSPRTYYPAGSGLFYATSSHGDVGSARNPTSHPSLYSSILAAPPPHQARTIHNAGDPPVPAPSRPVASPRVSTLKSASKRSPTETARSHAKSRKSDSASSTASPRRKAKRTSTDRGKQKQSSNAMDVDVDADGDVDMKAAATLTSLLLHHRPSIAGSAGSPRSSLDGSEAGSAYSHFQQSSTRTMPTNSPPVVPAVASAPAATESPARAQTPPSGRAPPAKGTPRPVPADNEAANLMLYLATSPSPARPTNKDAEAFRALGGGSAALRDKGRVLFASSCPEPRGAGETAKSAPMGRSVDTSFTSSISSIGTDMGADRVPESLTRSLSSQLLPPPTLPSRATTSRSPPAQRDVHESPRSVPSQGAVEFNFNDFIHASPSPLRATTVPGPKPNLGLRADIGRKLFEEEQMRHAMAITQSPGKR